MLLRNFDNIVNGFITGYVESNGNNFSEPGWLKGIPSIIKLPSGAYYASASTILFASGGLFGGGGDQAIDENSGYSQAILVVGSNDKEEDYNDYRIETITNLKVAAYRGNSYNTENGVHRLVATKTFVNDTETDITVKELGMIALITARTSSSSVTIVTRPLIAREKLATPVTIPANGGVATFTMTITIPVVDNSST